MAGSNPENSQVSADTRLFDPADERARKKYAREAGVSEATMGRAFALASSQPELLDQVIRSERSAPPCFLSADAGESDGETPTPSFSAFGDTNMP
jgi:hypothetical protein